MKTLECSREEPHFGKITAKMYSKGERVLRTEVIVHNTKELRCGRSLPNFSEIVLRLKEILNRFLNALRCMDIAAISDDSLDVWRQPSQIGQTRVGGVISTSPECALFCKP